MCWPKINAWNLGYIKYAGTAVVEYNFAFYRENFRWATKSCMFIWDYEGGGGLVCCWNIEFSFF